MRALDPEVKDAIWAGLEPHLPPRVDRHPLGCHRPRCSDRDCFDLIVVRLATGCSWEDAERLTGNKVSDTTARARRDEWIAAGAFAALSEEALAGFDKVIGLELSDVAVDGSLHKSPCGGDGTGKNPTDRAKLGWKWSILTDRYGIPFGWTVDGANRNDSVMLEPTLDDAGARGLLADIETIWLDRGYDSEVTRQRLAERLLDDAIIAKKRKRGEAKGKNPHPWGCDGRSSGPTRGLPHTVSSSGTRIASPFTGSLSLHWRSPSCSQPSSSTTGTAGHACRCLFAEPLTRIDSLTTSA